MIRRTSTEAYEKIKENGLLSQKRFRVFETLYRNPFSTATELMISENTNQANVRARLNELREMGVVYEVRERPCRITGMTVIEWDLTDRLPESKKEKRRTARCPLCKGHGKVFLE